MRTMIATAVAAMVCLPAGAAAQIVPAAPSDGHDETGDDGSRDDEKRDDAKKGEGEASTDERPDASATDLIVVGVKGSIEDARNKKRKAKQILEAVVAEDAGKLPDNNVAEALAHTTGVTIERRDGRGQNLLIRGLTGVQTTVNGREATSAPRPDFLGGGSNDAGTGGGRSINLADVPADLIKSVEVFKTRTADQPEGGIGGTVNVELRRPLDLPRGNTFAGSLRQVYNEVGKTWSPYASALVASRWETGAGDMGFLVNGAYSKGYWDEVFIQSLYPGRFFGKARDSLPAAVRDTAISPAIVQNNRNYGSNRTLSLNTSLQWRPSAELEFVLEGSWFRNEAVINNSNFELNLLIPEYTLSDLKFNDGGGLVGLTVNNPDAPIVLRTFNAANRVIDTTKQANFETHWSGGIARIDFALTYNEGAFVRPSVGAAQFYPDVHSVAVDFDSPAVPGGGPFIRPLGLDPTDVRQTRLGALSSDDTDSIARTYTGQIDLTLEPDPDGFLRTLKTGARFYRTTNNWNYGWRLAEYYELEGGAPLLSDLPGIPTVIQAPKVVGGTQQAFLTLDNNAIRANWASLRQFVRTGTPAPAFYVGAGASGSLEQVWQNARANDARGSGGNSREQAFSAYLMAEYAFTLGLRFDGNVGLRYVNTYGDTFGIDSGTRPVFTFNPQTKENELTGYEDYENETRLNGNTQDLLPSVYLTAHFTDSAQLRLAYSYNVQRPAYWDLRSSLFLDARGRTGAGGNPDLGPVVTKDYNASFEWVFGTVGSISLGGFLKRQSGFVVYVPSLESVPGYDLPFRIDRPRNAGKGQTQGIEASATSTFGFLAPWAKIFGMTANATWIPKAQFQAPFVPDREKPEQFTLIDIDAPFTSKLTYNLIGFFDARWISGRLAYNWRDGYREGLDLYFPNDVISIRPTSRLDGALNVTPWRFVTLSLEATNILRTRDRRYFGAFNIPTGLIQQGRTIQFGTRVRF